MEDKIYPRTSELRMEHRFSGADEGFLRAGKRGLSHRYGIDDIDTPLSRNEEIICERFYYEVGLIITNKHVQRYLVASELVRWVRAKAIPLDPGSGPIVGSLMAYLLGITEVDPLKNNLLVELSYYPGKCFMQSIEMDICMERGGEIIDYVLCERSLGNVELELKGADITVSFPDEAFAITFQGSEILSGLQQVCSSIKQDRGVEIDLNLLDMQDSATFEMLSSGEVDGIVWFEIGDVPDTLRVLKPECMNDLITALALCELDSGNQLDMYIKRKQSEECIVYEHPLLEQVFKETCGIVLFREQLLLAAQALAGFSLRDGNSLCRAMETRSPEVMCMQRLKFIEGCKTTNDIGDRLANVLFERYFDPVPRTVSKSETVAESYLCYQCAWLKVHYPEEFMPVFT